MSPWLLLLVLATLLQSALFSEVTIFGARPNLPLVLVIAWTVLRGGREGLIWGLAGGLLLDFYSAAPFGSFTIAMLVVALVASLIEELPFQPTVLVVVIATLFLSPLFHFVAMVTMQSLGRNVAWGYRWVLLAPAALLDGALILLLYRALRLLSSLAGERAIKWGRAGR